MGGVRLYVPNTHISAKLQLHQSFEKEHDTEDMYFIGGNKIVRAYRCGTAEKWIMLEE